MQLNYLKNPIIIVKYSISHFSDTFSLTFLKYLPVGPINTRISQALTIQFSDPGPLSSQGSIRVLSLYFFTYFFYQLDSDSVPSNGIREIVSLGVLGSKLLLESRDPHQGGRHYLSLPLRQR